MDELKMTGNALAGSRPLLTFDKMFDEMPHLQVIKKLFTQVWGTPKAHPKSKPFIDRVMSFYHADGKVWCRNYQLADDADTKKAELAALHRGEDLVASDRLDQRMWIGADHCDPMFPHCPALQDPVVMVLSPA